MMKSLVCVTPGQFEFQEKEIPELAEGKAILKIKRIGICGTDLHAFEGTQPYFNYPRILGHELAGELVEFKNLPDFKIDDPVTFIPYFSCGSCVACRNGNTNCCVHMQVCGVHVDGGMVEYLSVPTSALVPSRGLNFEELALVEPLSIGAHAIRRAGVRDGEFVLVIGAGPIGLGTMEFARIAGGRVIAMDINQDRLSFCKNTLKVDHIVNAATDNIAEVLKEITDGDWPTVVIDATGSAKAIMNGFNYLAHGGRYVLVGLQKGEISFSHPEFHKRESTLMSSRNATREDFDHVIHSMKTGKIKALNYITHKVAFEDLKEEFPTWLDPKTGVIKAMVELN